MTSIIRRTDKVGTEAAFHNLDEYMRSVDEYYDQLEMVEYIEKRRIFLASDDPKVIDEARKKYPQYDVIGDPEIAKIAAVSTRYTDTSLNGHIFFLRNFIFLKPLFLQGFYLILIC